MQALTDELKAILRDRFQVGEDGYRARVELDVVLTTSTGGGDPDTHDSPWDTATSYGKTCTKRANTGGDGVGAPNVTDADRGTENNFGNGVFGAGTFYRGFVVDLGTPMTVSKVSFAGGNDPGSGFGLWAGDTIAGLVELGTTFSESDLDGWSIDEFDPAKTQNGNLRTFILDTPTAARYWWVRESWTQGGLAFRTGFWCYGILINGVTAEGTSQTIETVQLPAPLRVSIDKSLRMAADQAEVIFPNEDVVFGWGTGSTAPTNSRLRIYQWYGDPASEVLTFTGLVDGVTDSRDPLTTGIKARDMMAVLIDQTFGATAPQGAGETGAVRTADNGVYLSMEISAIVEDILDRAGWPLADREITPTSYVLDEFVIPDGQSWAEAIAGDDRLAGLVGYSAWADETGVFHFAPTFAAGAVTEPPVPAYTYAVGDESADPLTSRHVLSLRRETDQDELRTRVKVRGPLTTEVLTDTWRELWRTRKFKRPVGIWYDPATPTYIRVIDRGTKRMYKLRQSDRTILSSVNLGAVISYPLGLSGDPADATIYWVLNAPWIYTGSTAGNSVKKVRKSDNHVLATYAIPDGRWSALKVSSSWLYLTNLDTDRFYRRSKADASAVANYQHVFNGNTQANPSGMMIDGTTLYLFWANGGSTARFLVCDESAPATVTDKVKTAGTTLHGGEMDTTTHTECWGDSDSLGLVAKFTLVAVSSQTDEVYAEAVDTELEDELGLLAQLEPREHDTHTTDADHPYEIRRDTLDVTIVTSLAQATETALRRLELLSRRREVLDVGTVGNPGLQKTDTVRVEDPLTGSARDWQMDTIRSDMDERGYLMTLALLPVDESDDAPTDEGDATE